MKPVLLRVESEEASLDMAWGFLRRPRSTAGRRSAVACKGRRWAVGTAAVEDAPSSGESRESGSGRGSKKSATHHGPWPTGRAAQPRSGLLRACVGPALGACMHAAPSRPVSLPTGSARDAVEVASPDTDATKMSARAASCLTRSR